MTDLQQSSFLFSIKGEEIRGDGEAGMRVLCSLDCFLLSGGDDIFVGPRKLGCWSSAESW